MKNKQPVKEGERMGDEKTEDNKKKADEKKRKCSNCEYILGGTCLRADSPNVNKFVLLFGKPCEYWKHS